MAGLSRELKIFLRRGRRRARPGLGPKRPGPAWPWVFVGGWRLRRKTSSDLVAAGRVAFPADHFGRELRCGADERWVTVRLGVERQRATRLATRRPYCADADSHRFTYRGLLFQPCGAPEPPNVCFGS